MAVFADVGRLYVQGALSGRVSAVVAANAIVRYVDVIEICWNPRHGRMAIVAVVAARYVCWMLANRCDTVMARSTRANNLGMVHGVGRYPNVRGVAVFADIAGLNMCRRFAGGVRAIMAVNAIAGNVDVIEVGREPSCCGVAVFAVVAACDVRWIFARRGNPIMTRAASTQYLRVVNREGRREYVRSVAIFAGICRLNVVGGLASGRGAVMTIETPARNVDVVEVGRQPSCCRMAVVAIVAREYVRWVLTGCGNPIVTRTARTQYLRVINGIGGRKNVRVVAILANVGCLYVRKILSRGADAVMATDAVADDTHVVEVCGPPADGRVAIFAVIATRDMRWVLAGRSDTVMA